MKKTLMIFSLTLALAIANSAIAGPIIVYSNDFDSDGPGLPSNFSGAGSVIETQGYSAFGFGSQFLYNGTGDPAYSTTLELNNLQAHDSINLDFMLALIDSWDGTNNAQYAPDYFNVVIGDGQDTVFTFSHTFSSFNIPTNQTYQTLAPLTEGTDIASFGTYWNDTAYDLSADSVFDNIVHSSSTLTVDFFASGDGWQGHIGYADEAWAIDNVEVSLNVIPAPGAFLLGSMGVGFVSWLKRRRTL